MSTRIQPCAEPDSVSYQTETNCSSSGRSTIISEISTSVVDQPNRNSNVTEENVKSNKPGCCLESECYCYCGRDCSDNCCCRCMQNVSCCVINFFYYLLLFLRYSIIIPIYIIVICLIFCLPPLWFCFVWYEDSSGNPCTELGKIWRKINSNFIFWNLHLQGLQRLLSNLIY